MAPLELGSGKLVTPCARMHCASCSGRELLELPDVPDAAGWVVGAEPPPHDAATRARAASVTSKPAHPPPARPSALVVSQPPGGVGFFCLGWRDWCFMNFFVRHRRLLQSDAVTVR